LDAKVIALGAPRGAAATKERILDTAEALFMEHGFEATGLRSITAAAGVNLAAVNYHFGTKEELFESVLTRRLDPMNQERLQLLDQLERDAAPLPLSCDRILMALLVPALRLARDPERGGKNFLRLLGRAYADPAPFIRHFLSEQYAVMIARFKDAFGRALPHLPRKELSWRLHFIMGALSYTLAGTTRTRSSVSSLRRAGQRRNTAAQARALPAGGIERAFARLDRSDTRSRRRAGAQALKRKPAGRTTGTATRYTGNTTMLTILFLVLVLFGALALAYANASGRAWALAAAVGARRVLVRACAAACPEPAVHCGFHRIDARAGDPRPAPQAHQRRRACGLSKTDAGDVADGTGRARSRHGVVGRRTLLRPPELAAAARHAEAGADSRRTALPR
jgi:AcrR family transcriptional regulator